MKKTPSKLPKKVTLENLARMVANGFADVRSEMNERFNQVDKKFTAVDKRFDNIDERIDGIEERLIRMEHNHGARIEILEDKLARR